MAAIELTMGYVSIIDDEDFNSLNQYNWWALDAHPRITYAGRWDRGIKPRRIIRMHHAVLGITAAELKERNLIVDHFDRDGLNNRKDNLRITTRSVNAFNSSRCDNAAGIYFDNYRLRYKCFILQPSKQFVGWYKTLDEALLAKEMFHEDH